MLEMFLDLHFSNILLRDQLILYITRGSRLTSNSHQETWRSSLGLSIFPAASVHHRWMTERQGNLPKGHRHCLAWLELPQRLTQSGKTSAFKIIAFKKEKMKEFIDSCFKMSLTPIPSCIFASIPQGLAVRARGFQRSCLSLCVQSHLLPHLHLH